MADGTSHQSSHQSSLKQFLSSIATIKGDLSNITAPPFVLADKSTTEFPRFWIGDPAIFCAPAKVLDPARRMLAVLKWWLSCQKSQNYGGREPQDGIKKPLNAFLGEVFIGEVGPVDDVTRLVSEQVSHHPPVTACYLWNAKHGIHAEGYTRQEITFNGTVNIKQIGHAVLRLDAFDEDYLIPLPNIHVKGVVTGSPYPELTDSYSIVSSSGLIADVNFSGKGMLGITGKKNHFEATVHRIEDSKRKDVLFTGEGSWSDSFTFKDNNGTEIESYNVTNASTTEFRTLPLEKQDPWESRRAWAGVINGIHSGDMQTIANHKTALEEAQRALRKQSETNETAWKPLFFLKEKSNPQVDRLLALIGASSDSENTLGSWRFDMTKVDLRRPWRGTLTPYGQGM
ncbi:Oxysterol-binding protein-like 4 [Acrodontium crateriforme]|uniref:Oxysterol-binding protein-like 4 n=1 Tax=Acrodontium crateriforme TaxID=150365 RepID=A0AAQ3M7A5_9PEZI|nr:Oxysterol-binding protein-like 4 [Acrodontium crateriforme]